MENRRGFLQKLMALAAAPTIGTPGIKADVPIALAAAASLMNGSTALTPAAEAFIEYTASEAALSKVVNATYSGGEDFFPRELSLKERPDEFAAAVSDKLQKLYHATAPSFIQYYKSIEKVLETKGGGEQFSDDMWEVRRLHHLQQRFGAWSKEHVQREHDDMHTLSPAIAKHYDALAGEILAHMKELTAKYGFKKSGDLVDFAEKYSYNFERNTDASAPEVAQALLYKKVSAFMTDTLSLHDHREKTVPFEVAYQFADMVSIAASGKSVPAAIYSARNDIEYSKEYPDYNIAIPNFFQGAHSPAQQKAYHERNQTMPLKVIAPRKYRYDQNSDNAMLALRVPVVKGLNATETEDYFYKAVKALGVTLPAPMSDYEMQSYSWGSSEPQKKPKLRPARIELMNAALTNFLASKIGAVVKDALIQSGEERAASVPVAVEVAAVNSAVPQLSGQETGITIPPAQTLKQRVTIPSDSWTVGAKQTANHRSNPER